MAHKIDDKWIWLGFGAFSLIAAKCIQYAIRDIVNLTKIDPDQYPREIDDRDEQPEDSISLRDLEILADSPHPNISTAAISIIASRFWRLPNARQILLKDLFSKDEEVSGQAETTMNFLESLGMPGVSHTNHPHSNRPLLDSPPDSPPTGARLSTSELARRLAIDMGNMNGGDGWPRDGIAPSEHRPVAGFAGWANVPRERPVNGDEDELERRRRRREAMVLHEGGGALRENDIIRPRNQ